MSFSKNFFSRFVKQFNEENNVDEVDLKDTENVAEKSNTQASPEVETKISIFDVMLQSDSDFYKLWKLSKDTYKDLQVPVLEFCMPEFEPVPLEEKILKSEETVFLQKLDGFVKKRFDKVTAELEKDSNANCNSEILIHPSIDRLAAWIMLFPPVNQGAELTKDEIVNCLAKRGITYGLDENLLNQLSEREDRFFHIFPIARGVQAIDGQNGEVIDHFSRERKRYIEVDEFNNVDYTSIDTIQKIEKDDIICDIILATKGVAGMNISGREIPAKDGIEANVPQGRNTDLSEDKKTLVATCTGHLEFSGRTFHVKPVLDIRGNVDYSTGNIKFLGDVNITGDVKSGFTVRATGDIYVGGAVEAATIEAGGTIVIVGGVLGQYNAVIRSHKSIYAKYMEHSNIYAREEINAGCLIDCEVYSNDTIIVRNGRGVVIGGNIFAGSEVSAKIIGSKAEMATNIILGGQPFDDLEHSQLKSQLKQTEEKIAILEKQPKSQNKDGQLSKLRIELCSNKIKLDKLEKEFEKLNKDQKDEIENIKKCRLVCNTAYPATSITINNYTLRLDDIYNNCNVKWVDGEVVCV